MTAVWHARGTLMSTQSDIREQVTKDLQTERQKWWAGISDMVVLDDASMRALRPSGVRSSPASMPSVTTRPPPVLTNTDQRGG